MQVYDDEDRPVPVADIWQFDCGGPCNCTNELTEESRSDVVILQGVGEPRSRIEEPTPSSAVFVSTGPVMIGLFSCLLLLLIGQS